KEIKPKTYQLNAGQTLFLGGLGRFDFIDGDKQGFTAFFDNNLKLHRTKLDGADAFYDKHVGSLLMPPGPKELAEVLGSGIALNLLFGIPIMVAILVTVLDVF
ncbi:hypothetical protein KFY46_26625, partial [Salmonella enterica subsp. enterica serovar 1,4,[5],12:i:-]|nr:hypothetical protein [Salmonella enterica subsp. enterica serovar 1,4,[5],12:i:-]